MSQQRKSWSREQIRQARRRPLLDLLTRRGLHLAHVGGDNYTISEHPGIVIRQWYWNAPQDERSGNTIDFMVDILGLSFANAMEEILKHETNE